MSVADPIATYRIIAAALARHLTGGDYDTEADIIRDNVCSSDHPDDWEFAEDSIDWGLEDLRLRITAVHGARWAGRIPHPDLEPDRTKLLAGRIVEHQHHTDYDDPPDNRWGFAALARAHHRECGYDFGALPDDCLAVGWWEPRAYSWGGPPVDPDTGEPNHARATGRLLAHVLVHQGGTPLMLYAYCCESRRRQGITSRLVRHIVDTYGITEALGPLSDAGAALLTSCGLDLEPAQRRARQALRGELR